MMHRCLPHARGGVSGTAWAVGAHEQSSPRPWGCFLLPARDDVRLFVFPTPVGVFLFRSFFLHISPRLPHARGGVSDARALPLVYAESSPRPWGCFLGPVIGRILISVFPTPVGVFLPSLPRRSSLSRLPHARGGVSLLAKNCVRSALSSPRPWGCFRRSAARRCRRGVFPTPVGVFPHCPARRRFARCLPHARGGVSAAATVSAEG